MHGPGPRTDTNFLGWEPDYPQPIQVLDTFVGTLWGRRKRRHWREARGQALDLWTPTGLTFEVTEDAADNYAPYDVYDGVIPGAFYTLPGMIRIVRVTDRAEDAVEWSDEYYPSSWANASLKWKDGLPDRWGGAVFMKPNPWWWPWGGDFWTPQLPANLGHEIGHTLGLWHRAGAIMGGGLRPDDHDIESVHDWYLVEGSS